MGPQIIIFIIIMLCIVIGQGKKSKSSRKRSSSSAQGRYASSRDASGYSRPASGTQRSYRLVKDSSGNTVDGRVYATIDFDNTHYHAEGFDFDSCISFKGLPTGTDELAVLIASNSRHEKELAKLLQVNED